MRLISSFGCLFAMLLVLGCASNPKPEASAEQMEALAGLVFEQSFEIAANWAEPLATGSLTTIANSGLLPPGSTINRIDLFGNSSYIRVTKDSVKAQLPYYGERQIGSGSFYGARQTGIQFEGVPKDFEIVPNKRKSGYTMRFTISTDIETFQVAALLFPDKSSTININSTHRTPIGYRGRVSEYNAKSNK